MSRSNPALFDTSAVASTSSTHNTGPRGDDLSFSELSLSDKPIPAPKAPRFSLFAQPLDTPLKPEPSSEEVIEEEEEEEEEEEGEDADLDRTMRAADVSNTTSRLSVPAMSREERLNRDLIALRALNASFAAQRESLKLLRSGAEHVTRQVEDTNKLLDKYVNVLVHTERNSQLIFDPGWEGGQADDDAEERERLEEEERERRAGEEAERREQARLEAEKLAQEQKERGLEKERVERERQERLAARGIRGVRGTRASIGRGRATVSSSRGRVLTTANTATRRTTRVKDRDVL